MAPTLLAGDSLNAKFVHFNDIFYKQASKLARKYHWNSLRPRAISIISLRILVDTRRDLSGKQLHSNFY